MLKLIKYELKTISKEFLILLGVVVLLNLALMTRINAWGDDAIMGLSFLIWFGVCVGAFIFNIIMFTRDLKQDTGYLVLTLPRSGYQILGAKLISALIVSAATAILGGVVFLFMVAVPLGKYDGIINALHQITKDPTVNTFALYRNLFVDLIISIAGYTSTLLIIYFSCVISKMIMNKRKYSGFVSFLIFIVINLVYGKLYQLISKAFPKTLNPYVTYTGDPITVASGKGSVDILLLPVNVVGGIFSLLVTVGLFMGTAYIMERKLDL